jgi:ABC-2 type transport system permease protein
MKVQWIGFLTLMRKEVTRVFRIWPQTLLPSVMTTTLYFVIFGNFMGSRLGQLDGFKYIDFIIPGLIMMAVITTAYSNVSSTVFSAKFQRNIDELLVSPMKNSTILLGHLSGGIIRGCLVGVLVMLVSLFFTDIQIHDFSLVVITMFMTSLLFSLGGFLNALFADKFDDISIIPTFILTPLTYLGGVFYSVNLLPSFWRQVSLFNPILYIVNIFRFSVLGISDISIIYASLYMSLTVIFLWTICLTLLNRGYGIRS